MKSAVLLLQLPTSARTASPLLSHFIDRGPANRAPCAFSALYIGQQCSTEFLHLVWANKTHFLQLLRGSHKSDASTSLTQQRPCKTVPLRSEHICRMPVHWRSLITVNEERYFGRFQYLCRLHTWWRLFYAPGRGDEGGEGRWRARCSWDWLTTKWNWINSSSMKHCQTSPFLYLPWID